MASSDRSPEKRALDYAKSLIESYQLDIRASEWTGVNLVEKGFCQGTIYQDALETIGRIERGELIV